MNMALSEEDIRLLKKAEQRRQRPRYKTTEELEREYYEEHPEKAPLKTKFKKAIQDYRQERAKEKEFRKRAYRDAKYSAIYEFEKKKARQRYNPSPRPPTTHKTPVYRPPVMQQPARRQEPPIDYGSGLFGNIGGGGAFGSIDGGSLLGGFGPSNKKKKKKKDSPLFDDFMGWK